MSTRVDFVCDTYRTPSIKDIERERRGSEESSYLITGPQQSRPKDWQHALQSPSFKTSLLRFLADEWKNTSYAQTIAGHEVYVAVDETCYYFTATNGIVHRDEVVSLNCSHEEADTRIVLHVNHAHRSDSKAFISVRGNDTDILVLLLYHVSHALGTPKVWMDAGLSSTNNRRYISVTQLVDHMYQSVVDALPGLYAFTGSDYTASFMNKGKARPLGLMMKGPSFIECFGALGKTQSLPEKELATTEEFVCILYGRKNLKKVDNARFAMFLQNYAPKKIEDPMAKIKGINPSSMPPCKAVLANKIKRANYVASVWKNAGLVQPCTLSPEESGWILDDGSYKIKWFDGDQLPKSLCEILNLERLQPALSEETEDEEMTYGETLLVLMSLMKKCET
jgi:hypothetical protein